VEEEDVEKEGEEGGDNNDWVRRQHEVPYSNSCTLVAIELQQRSAK
jgi:hypothetical protein